MAKVIAIWGVVAIASAIVAGIVASVKRRDHSFWAAWSFLVPPMLLILLLMPLEQGPTRASPRHRRGRGQASVLKLRFVALLARQAGASRRMGMPAAAMWRLAWPMVKVP